MASAFLAFRPSRRCKPAINYKTSTYSNNKGGHNAKTLVAMAHRLADSDRVQSAGEYTGTNGCSCSQAGHCRNLYVREAGRSVLGGETPQPEHDVDTDQLDVMHPGQILKPYKGVTAIYHQHAPKDNVVVANKAGLHRVIDYLNIDPNGWTMIPIIWPDANAKIFSSPIPDEKKFVVQTPLTSPLDINSAMVIGLLKFKDQHIKQVEAKKQSAAIVSAMACLKPDIYLKGIGDA